jgi:hypothetical protein
MRNRQEWFNEKMAAVSPEIVSEVQLSADIIARIDAILGLSCTCMNNNSTTHKTMDINKKELYLSPEVKTFEVKTEGAICTVSGSESLQDYNWNEPVIE